MSDVAGLIIFFFVIMLFPTLLIFYLKWDVILIKYESKFKKKKDEDDYLMKGEKTGFLKNFFSTYFGKGGQVSTTESSTEKIIEKISNEENLSAQELLTKQRKIEEANKKKILEEKEKNEKKFKKNDEKQKIKEFKEKQKIKEKELKKKNQENKRTKKKEGSDKDSTKKEKDK